MLVDRSNIKTSEDLMAMAHRAARAYKQGQKTVYNSKASLPDLTFLKDYADEKPVVARRVDEQAQSGKMKTSASAAVISQKSKEKGKLCDLGLGRRFS